MQNFINSVQNAQTANISQNVPANNPQNPPTSTAPLNTKEQAKLSPQPTEDSFVNSNKTNIAIGAVALGAIGLGLAAYTGKLGKGAQEFLQNIFSSKNINEVKPNALGDAANEVADEVVDFTNKFVDNSSGFSNRKVVDGVSFKNGMAQHADGSPFEGLYYSKNGKFEIQTGKDGKILNSSKIDNPNDYNSKLYKSYSSSNESHFNANEKYKTSHIVNHETGKHSKFYEFQNGSKRYIMEGKTGYEFDKSGNIVARFNTASTADGGVKSLDLLDESGNISKSINVDNGNRIIAVKLQDGRTVKTVDHKYIGPSESLGDIVKLNEGGRLEVIVSNKNGDSIDEILMHGSNKLHNFKTGLTVHNDISHITMKNADAIEFDNLHFIIDDSGKLIDLSRGANAPNKDNTSGLFGEIDRTVEILQQTDIASGTVEYLQGIKSVIEKNI